MRKKSLSLLCLSFAIACSSLAACGNTKLSEDNNALPIYVPYNEIPEVYPEEAACADGCVVMESLYPSWILYTKQFLESSRLVSGEESWEKFLMSVETGESAKLRIVYYHIDSAGEEQGYQVFDLSYEDGKYFLYSEKDGEEVTEEYAALKCFRGNYHTQEWFLLGEGVLETDYKTILDVAIFSSRTVILENHVPGTPTWQLICFSDSGEEPDMKNLPPQESPALPASDAEDVGEFHTSPAPSLVSFTPTRLYAAATYALSMDEDGNATYLYTGRYADGSDMVYPDFKEYRCAGIVEDSYEPGIITQDLKKRVGSITSEEWGARIYDSLLSGEPIGASTCSALERLEQQETWQDVCQMVSSRGDWYAALRTDGTVFSLGCFGSYELVEEDWTDIVQIVSGGNALFGLKSDGTVCAHLKMNYMRYGKTLEEEIREWSDIVQIAGEDSVTGLKKDGTVVSVKGGIFRECQEWSGITEIAASRYALVGIKEDGTLMAICSEKCGFQEEELAGWKDIEHVAVCDEYCIAIGKDKTVYRTGQRK